jgi:hypothetical protein
VEDHLAGLEPELAALFAALQESVAALGPYSAVPVKSEIDFRAAAKFLGVKTRADHLLVELRLPERREHARFERVATLPGASYAHTVKLTTPEDLDDEFLGWLAEAYALGSGATRRA